MAALMFNTMSNTTSCVPIIKAVLITLPVVCKCSVIVLDMVENNRVGVKNLFSKFGSFNHVINAGLLRTVCAFL